MNLKESLDMKKNIGFTYNQSSLVPYSQIPQPYYSSFDDYLRNDPQAQKMINQGFDLRGLGELLDTVLDMGKDIGLETTREMLQGGATPMDAAKIVVAREIISYLQPEIDRVRNQSLDKFNKNLLALLPKMKKVIEQKGTSSSRELISMIDNKLKSVIPFASKKNVEEIKDDNQENVLLNAIPNEDISVDLSYVGISPDIKLTLANPREMFNRVYNNELQTSIDKNIVVPMQNVLDREVVKPLKKRAVIVGSSIFALGALTTLGGVWAYLHFKGKKENNYPTNNNSYPKKAYNAPMQPRQYNKK